MGYEELEILRSYKTNKHNIVKDFYTPVLSCSVMYKRAVGFFSSTALIELSKGISGLIRNKGRIRFIVSPLLSTEDIEAINRGYNEREIIKASLMREFKEPTNSSETERLNWLANLIANGYLEIKVAFTPAKATTGMYHEKIGVLYDTYGNKISFTGSMNETVNAFHNNFESIVVFNSLVDEDIVRVVDIERDFDMLWAGREPNINIYDFPKAVKDKLLSYKKDFMKLELDAMEEEYQETACCPPLGIPAIPLGVKLHDYQNEAIEKWAQNDYCGIFDMATGTGKTFTGLGAITRLVKDKKRAAIVIVCPYQHLVEQWVEDIVKFNLRPIVGYSASSQKDWKKRLTTDIFDFKLKIIDTICFVTTNATFSSDFVQAQMKKLGKDTLLLVDEAHNFGAIKLRKTLDGRIEYRLALSATLDRHGDPEGTKTLYNYFGDKCIEYPLERAIEEGKLTPYYYHPITVYLTSNELQTYRELSKKIARQCHKTKSGELHITELGKKLLIERSRVVAGASNKVALLRQLMENFKNDSHMLIYCGAARNQEYNNDYSEKDDEGERQIVAVSKMLGLELDMKVTHFTSSETSEERELIKKQFAECDPYQAIVAIKCLDEGVNIPSIKTAFILASSTNPKEYIQRRGRVLRKFSGKNYATIYDFITLPVALDYVSSGSENANMDVALIKKEMRRINEFGRISENPSEADSLIKQLSETYEISAFDNMEDIEYEL